LFNLQSRNLTFRCQNLATRDAAQEHRFFNPNDDFLGVKNMLAFHPYRARDLVTDPDKCDGLEFRVQKDSLRRSGEEAVCEDHNAANRNIEGDDFGMFTVAAEAMNDEGVMCAANCSDSHSHSDTPGLDREAKTGEPNTKKMHLDTTASALDAVMLQLPGVHHHMHEQAR
jgi:hypothetical protein